MTDFEKALSKMTATIFPAPFDADSCFKQAKRCWVLMDETPCFSDEHVRYFYLADYWCKQSHQCHEENRKAIYEFDRIFGDFITESFRCLSKSKKIALIKQSLNK